MDEIMLAIDIGASGGRHIAGRLQDGRLMLTEVYRFENGPIRRGERLVWDAERLFDQVKAGLCAAKARGLVPSSIAVDSWGVDFVLLDQTGRRLGEAVSYRDERARRMEHKLADVMSQDALYARTGIQKQPFNTVYQLLERKEENELRGAKDMLMIPEYLNYLLTGRRVREYTNASTTGLLDARAKDWDRDLIARCGFPDWLFGPLAQAGASVGRLLPAVREEVGFDCEVVLAPTHDTAAAVMAAPLDRGDAYLSSGTWSLLGLELDRPILTQNSRALNMTNEGGAFGTIRYLKNIMGLWMLQQLRKERFSALSYSELAQLARDADGYPGVVDAEDGRFLAPISMTGEIENALREGGFAPPQTPGDLAACVCHSLAACYARATAELESLTGAKIGCLRVVGGGCQNDYLNALTARALARPVTAGPVEATAIGNILAQLRRAGYVSSLEEGRALVRRSFPIKLYAPE